MARTALYSKEALAIVRQMKELEITQADIAKAVDKSQSWVSQSLLQDTERTFLRLIINAPDDFHQILKTLQWTPRELMYYTGLDLPLSSGLNSDDAPMPVGNMVGIRHMGSVTAGTEAAYETNDYEYVEFPVSLLNGYDPSDLFALTVVGDSMMCDDVQRDIPEGATALFHAHLPPEPGDTVAAWVDHPELGDIRVLKIHKPGGGYVTLESLNHKHRPIYISHDSEFRIFGVFLASFNPGRRLRHSLESKGMKAQVNQQLARVRKKD